MSTRLKVENREPNDEKESLRLLYLECRAGVTVTRDSGDNAKETHGDKEDRLKREAKKAKHIYYVHWEIVSAHGGGDVRMALHKIEELALNLYKSPWKKELYTIKSHGVLISNYLRPALIKYSDIFKVLGYKKHDNKYVLDISREMECDSCSEKSVDEYLKNVFRDKVSKIALDLYTLQLELRNTAPVNLSRPVSSKSNSPHTSYSSSSRAMSSSSYGKNTTHSNSHDRTYSDMYGRGQQTDHHVKTNEFGKTDEFGSSGSQASGVSSCKPANNITNVNADLKPINTIENTVGKSKLDNIVLKYKCKDQNYESNQTPIEQEKQQYKKSNESGSSNIGRREDIDNRNLSSRPINPETNDSFVRISDPKNWNKDHNKFKKTINEEALSEHQQQYVDEDVLKQGDKRTTRNEPSLNQISKHVEEKESVSIGKKVISTFTNENVKNINIPYKNSCEISSNIKTPVEVHNDLDHKIDEPTRSNHKMSTETYQRDALLRKETSNSKSNERPVPELEENASGRKKQSDNSYKECPKGYKDDAIEIQDSNINDKLGLKLKENSNAQSTVRYHTENVLRTSVGRTKDFLGSLNEKTCTVSPISQNFMNTTENPKHTNEQSSDQIYHMKTRSQSGASGTTSGQTEYKPYRTSTSTDSTNCIMCVDAESKDRTRTGSKTSAKPSDVKLNQCEKCLNADGYQYVCEICEQLHPFCSPCFLKEKYRSKCKKGGVHQFKALCDETAV